MKGRQSKTVNTPAFTCTEHHGTADINELILEPLINFINESFGREIVYARESEPEKVTIIEKPADKKVPSLGKNKIAQ